MPRLAVKAIWPWPDDPDPAREQLHFADSQPATSGQKPGDSLEDAGETAKHGRSTFLLDSSTLRAPWGPGHL
jgi:hypothetical protein